MYFAAAAAAWGLGPGVGLVSVMVVEPVVAAVGSTTMRYMPAAASVSVRESPADARHVSVFCDDPSGLNKVNFGQLAYVLLVATVTCRLAFALNVTAAP